MGLRPGSVQECSVPCGPRSPTLSQSNKQMLSSRVTHGKPLPGSTKELVERDPGIAVKPVEFYFPVAEVVLWVEAPCAVMLSVVLAPQC